ncbi:DUF4810 domain-containing protein [Pseudoalteromonas prydzensis]|jgi:hypothetical protein|uniref:DUF4810 domain-containing protein n=1 Tax=Pseudoalteromonas prydzensis TaxID=182141 RepID=UPI0037047D48
MNKIITTTAVLLLTVLTGCKTVQPLYYYGSYDVNLYQHFKADDISVAEQISQLEETVQMADNKSLLIAPGILAHLGYLHLKQGELDSGFAYLEKEKALYPESEQYINFLIENAKGGKQ